MKIDLTQKEIGLLCDALDFLIHDMQNTIGGCSDPKYYAETLVLYKNYNNDLKQLKTKISITQPKE